MDPRKPRGPLLFVPALLVGAIIVLSLHWTGILYWPGPPITTKAEAIATVDYYLRAEGGIDRGGTVSEVDVTDFGDEWHLLIWYESYYLDFEVNKASGYVRAVPTR
jgi:hypothetical protein